MTIYADVSELMLLAARYRTQQVDVPDHVNVIYSREVGFLVNEEEASKIVSAKLAGVVQLKIKLCVSSTVIMVD